MRKSRFLLTPVLLWLFLFLIVPMLIVVGISFLSRDALGNIVFSFSLEGYKTFFDPLYLGIYWDTLVLSLLTTVICLLVSYPLAYYIAGASPRIQTWGLILITVPSLMPYRSFHGCHPEAGLSPCKPGSKDLPSC